jgi:hypothetical protein
MIQAVNHDVAIQARRTGTSSNGQRRWYTDLIGEQKVDQVQDGPQSHYTEMDANGVIVPHFHQVSQFQIMVSGTGSIGRNPLPLVGLHFADHHTAYGPINAGPYGLGLFTLRARSDPGAIYIGKPGYKEFLKPSKKRYLLAENIALSTECVLQHREQVTLESVLEKDADTSDGLFAGMLRMGAGAKTTSPDPRETGGMYFLALNGGMKLDGANYPTWSLIYADRTDAPLEFTAGPLGLEALVLSFPRFDS